MSYGDPIQLCAKRRRCNKSREKNNQEERGGRKEKLYGQCLCVYPVVTLNF